MASDKSKGRKWDGKSRVSNDRYRKNYNEIFQKKQREEREKKWREELLKEIEERNGF